MDTNQQKNRGPYDGIKALAIKAAAKDFMITEEKYVQLQKIMN